MSESFGCKPGNEKAVVDIYRKHHPSVELWVDGNIAQIGMVAEIVGLLDEKDKALLVTQTALEVTRKVLAYATKKLKESNL